LNNTTFAAARSSFENASGVSPTTTFVSGGNGFNAVRNLEAGGQMNNTVSSAMNYQDKRPEASHREGPSSRLELYRTQ
jgi:hypothetical protein